MKLKNKYVKGFHFSITVRALSNIVFTCNWGWQLIKNQELYSLASSLTAKKGFLPWRILIELKYSLFFQNKRLGE